MNVEEWFAVEVLVVMLDEIAKPSCSRRRCGGTEADCVSVEKEELGVMPRGRAEAAETSEAAFVRG